LDETFDGFPSELPTAVKLNSFNLSGANVSQERAAANVEILSDAFEIQKVVAVTIGCGCTHKQAKF
jgi:hypothetical protein